MHSMISSSPWTKPLPFSSVTPHSPADALSSSFGWFVLAALVDNVTLDQKPARLPVANELSVTISVEKAFT
jgi:serine/threonine-protein kinase RsbW